MGVLAVKFVERAKPRVKPEHAPHRISGDRIRVGGSVHGIATEIADPTGAVWTLLECLDGTRPAGEIVDHVVERHPDSTREDIRGVLGQLIAMGYIEDTRADEPDELTERERTRYARGARFYRWVDLAPRPSRWETQLKLRDASVAVIGLGGTGGALALSLAASGVGHLHCVDGGTVELADLNHQVIYAEPSIGRGKAEAAAARLRELNSDISVTVSAGHLSSATGLADLTDLARRFDVLVLATGRTRAVREWANHASLRTRTPWVDAGYQGPRTAVAVYVPGLGACYECLRLADPAQEAEIKSNAAHAASAGIAGFLASYAVISLVAGISPVRSGRISGLNLVDPERGHIVEAPRRPGCPACGVKSGR
ncbi:ThiF family adenylyltransferase [Allokutzneria albata]|uniref:Molybdopterin or thiamine biosynthesis adenylyltransferase n=1 Tax=Allokutzneria albata TaxID=211114 RepID=A0A1G9XWR5_ALLAB|nr:ThiF family adenylyltransferase [Allokutzneria albata]SDN00916.1 Molybdopterin or thiamine biosynthesis adenylyltransferase [Allokutzneria albata]